jgi:glycosyltransferase involved in cell wall biosynthesis
VRRLTDRLRRRSRPLAQRAPAKLLDVLRDGAAPLATPSVPARESLRIAIVVPQFRRGSGGHQTIAHLVRGLERRHDVELWLQDDEGRHAEESEAESQALFRSFFGPTRAPLRRGFEAFRGADVAVATGWQTVPRVLSLRDVTARAYLVQDHEPEFYATSAERIWAEWTYRQGLHCICASPWLAEVVRIGYGATAAAFDLGVDHERYRPTDARRRDDVVLVYARAVTARRAVPLALLAMEELVRRRPHVEVVLFGEAAAVDVPFAHRQPGVLEADALVEAYATSTVGVVLSLTNPSLVTTEMLACGLPVVDVRTPSVLATFGEDGPVQAADIDPLSVCAKVEHLLDDADLRARVRIAGVQFVADRRWDHAAQAVEIALWRSMRMPPNS